MWRHVGVINGVSASKVFGVSHFRNDDLELVVFVKAIIDSLSAKSHFISTVAVIGVTKLPIIDSVKKVGALFPAIINNTFLSIFLEPPRFFPIRFSLCIPFKRPKGASCRKMKSSGQKIPSYVYIAGWGVLQPDFPDGAAML